MHPQMISCLGSTPCLVARREMLNIFLLFMLSSLLTCEAITYTGGAHTASYLTLNISIGHSCLMGHIQLAG